MRGVPDELQPWLRQQVDNAVQDLINADAFEDALIEVKPTWVLPARLLIGQAREQGNPRAFRWFICGEVPLDHVAADVATTPREVLHHFSMKWQMDASHLNDEASKALIDRAEALYTLAADDRFWR